MLLDGDAFSDLGAADAPIPAGDEPSSGEATCEGGGRWGREARLRASNGPGGDGSRGTNAAFLPPPLETRTGIQTWLHALSLPRSLVSHQQQKL